jgi:hypothetical protein
MEALVDALLTAIVIWLSANFSMPVNFNHPRIEYAPQAKMVELRLHGMLGDPSAGEIPDVVAAYDDDHHTIFLPVGWSGTTPAELSLLVHEMVHHLQNVNGQKFECPAAREKTAYLAQDLWLKQFDQSLESDFQIDKLTLLVQTTCML